MQDKSSVGSPMPRGRLTAIQEVEEERQSVPSITTDSQDILLDMTKRTA